MEAKVRLEQSIQERGTVIERKGKLATYQQL
jgi:hypothetical protein